MHGKKRSLSIIVMLFALIFSAVTVELKTVIKGDPNGTLSSPKLSITCQTDKATYLLRQKVKIQGNLQLDGIPATDLVVGVEVTNPLGYPELVRTLQVGTPSQTWPIEIKSLSLTDTGNNPINTAKTGNTVIAGITLKNLQLAQREIYGTITVFEGNMVPIGIHFFSLTLDPNAEIKSSFSFEIPKWARSSQSLIVGTVFSKEPKTGGIALSPEKTMYYCISKTKQGFYDLPYVPPPSQNTPGNYSTFYTLSPAPREGTYNVYVLGQVSAIVTSVASASFKVQNSVGYPPQASFIFTPEKIFANATVTFDASFSTPEGYNDQITKYKWDFGDGTPKQTTTVSYINHNYLQGGVFLVTLNVTDGEGLWCVTSKPLTVYPEFGPTANFTWTPILPFNNEFVTFNASGSTPGWCAKTSSFSPIVNYTWNFGDGTGNITTTSTAISHIFGVEGNFTVKLLVTDACGRTNIKSAIVQVLNFTGTKTYDVNGDGIIDLKDVFRVALAYGSFPGHPRWDPACDFNKDNIVDLKDYYPVAMHYGEDP
jgi:hypothetical protein